VFNTIPPRDQTGCVHESIRFCGSLDVKCREEAKKQQVRKPMVRERPSTPKQRLKKGLKTWGGGKRTGVDKDLTRGDFGEILERD